MRTREQLRKWQGEILIGALDPQRRSEINDMAAALIGNANDDLIAAEMVYNGTLETFFGQEKTANRAEVKAKATEHYRQLQLAKATQMELLELCRSLRKSLDVLREEMRFTPR